MSESSKVVNGIDTAAVRAMIGAIEKDPAEALATFSATTKWLGATKSVAEITRWSLGKVSHEKSFKIVIDEPRELLGTDSAPNPQEFLLAALNACMTVGYVAAAAMAGVQLTKLEIATTGELDLRGFLGLDKSVKPGYDELSYVVTMAGNGTREQFSEIHETVVRTSPNRWNLANPITMRAKLIVE